MLAFPYSVLCILCTVNRKQLDVVAVKPASAGDFKDLLGHVHRLIINRI